MPVARMGRPRLSLVMSLLFIGLSIPILIFILIYNYNKNSAGMVSILNDAVAQTSRAGVERTENLIDSTESPLRFLAEVAAADPGYFRTEQSRDLLYRALTSATHIDAVYVSFEDGYHRVVTRIDEDRRRDDPRIPAAANWHSSYIDAITFAPLADPPSHILRHMAASSRRIRCCHRRRHSHACPAIRPPRQRARSPLPSPQSIPTPVLLFSRCAFRSFAASISSAARRPTSPWTCCHAFSTSTGPAPRSTTLIADRNNGKIIAFPNKQKGVRVENGAAQDRDPDRHRRSGCARGSSPARRHGYRQISSSGRPANGEDLIAAFANFPDGFGQPWQVITLTPIDDFVGTLKSDQSVDDGRHHHPHRDRVVLHLFRVEPAVAAGRKRVPAIAGH